MRNITRLLALIVTLGTFTAVNAQFDDLYYDPDQ